MRSQVRKLQIILFIETGCPDRIRISPIQFRIIPQINRWHALFGRYAYREKRKDDAKVVSQLLPQQTVGLARKSVSGWVSQKDLLPRPMAF